MGVIVSLPGFGIIFVSTALLAKSPYLSHKSFKVLISIIAALAALSIFSYLSASGSSITVRQLVIAFIYSSVVIYCVWFYKFAWVINKAAEKEQMLR